MQSTYNPSQQSLPPLLPHSYFDGDEPHKPSLDVLMLQVPHELQSDCKELYAELANNGMTNHEARVCLILDVSGSMQNPNQFFIHPSKGNQIQTLINKALTLAFLFDNNKKVEIIPFGDKAYPVVEVDKNNYMNATQLVFQSIGNSLKEYTNYAEAIKGMRNFYFKDSKIISEKQKCSDAPVFAIFITDGEPNVEKIEAMNQFKSASYQATFIKFIALKGQQADTEFAYLKSIDDVKANASDDYKFYLDNSDLVVLDYPEQLTMDKLIHEYRPWLIQAVQKQILTHNAGLKVASIDQKSEGRVLVHHQSSNTNVMFQASKPAAKNSHADDKLPQPPKGCCTIL